MSCLLSDHNQFKSALSVQEDIPIALRTRSKIHRDASSLGMISNESETQSQSSFGMEIVEQLLQFNKQAVEGHLEMSSKFQLIYNQQKIISELQGSKLEMFCSELAMLKFAIVEL